MKLDAIRPKMLAAVAAVIIVIVTAGIFVAKKLAPSTEKDVQWKTYTDASYEFSLKFPDSWSFTSVEPEDEDILASYILTDPSVTTPQQEQQVLAAVHVNTRPYIQVVNRVELLSHLWDFNYSSFSNVVDVHVKNLRKKLGNGNSSAVLETVRGVGYRLKT